MTAPTAEREPARMMTAEEWIRDVAPQLKGRMRVSGDGVIRATESGCCPLLEVYPTFASRRRLRSLWESIANLPLSTTEGCRVVCAADDRDAPLRRALLAALGLEEGES